MPVLTVATERSVALRMVLTTRSASAPARLNSLDRLGRVGLDDSANEVMRASSASATDLVREFDMLVDRVDAADPQVLEAADRLAERTFGLAGDVGDGTFGGVGDLNERALGGTGGVVERCAAVDRIGFAAWWRTAPCGFPSAR